METRTTLYQGAIEDAFGRIQRARQSFSPSLGIREIGRVLNVSAGVASVSGLSGAGFEELLQFPHDLSGIAFNLDENEIGAVLLGSEQELNVGDDVLRTGRVLDIPVGPDLIGRVVDPLGRPLDGKGPVSEAERLPIERPAPAIIDRSPVMEPLQTGIKAIDALIPIGHGQRELIVGDRQTGKTAIAIDTILNQKGKDVLCVYCSIGQPAASVAQVIAQMKATGACEYSTVMAADASGAPGLKYIAPYAATSIAEYFVERGKKVLIVYDDLTHHARAYRELSLLLRRPPGREAFPGDIFYIHSRLLERATHLRPSRGGGSLTALPIIETEAQNISAFIPTNLISITDGQIYLSPLLFQSGVLPAIDVAKSVSRVGGQAQCNAYRAVIGDLKLSYSQFEELESFARFGTRLDDQSRAVLEHGRRTRECLKQNQSDHFSVSDQLLTFIANSYHLLDAIPLDQIAAAQLEIRNAVPILTVPVAHKLRSGQILEKHDLDEIVAAISVALRSNQP